MDKMYWSRRTAIDVSEGFSTDISPIQEHAKSLTPEECRKQVNQMKRHAPKFYRFESFEIMIPIYERNIT